jgi:trans-aconitate methyltransferase
MNKSEKELAFLHDLYVSSEWTERFTKIFDDKFKPDSEEKILYVNAGTGTHTLALRDLFDNDTEITAITETIELQKIAQAKADVIKANVEFTTISPYEDFDLVIADASFVRRENLPEFIADITNFANNQVAFFLPTVGSFGEVFSILWETLFNLNLTEKNAEIERLISELPTVSSLEEIAKNVGLTKVESSTNFETFEFENGKAFIESPFISNFLMPNWLSFLNEKEAAKVTKNFIKTVQENQGDISFRITLKATLVKGEIK